MLRLDVGQVAQLDAVQRALFLERLEVFLASAHPQAPEVADPVTLGRVVRAVVDEAGTFGIRAERGVALYASLRLQHGASMATRADLPFDAILRRRDLGESQKTAALWRAMQRLAAP